MTKTARKSPAKKPANLPRWNLNDLYKGMTDPKLEKDFKWAESHAQDFKKTYEGYLSTLNGEALAAAIEAYEKIDEVLGRIMSYAYLLYSTNQEDSTIAGFYQGAQERVTAISTFTLFFALELNKVDDAILRKQLQSAAIQKYEPWIRDIRVFRPHQLSQEIEQKLHEKRVVGRAAWNRLFDETLAGMRFPYQGKHLTEAEILNLFSNPKREVRAKAAHSFAKVLSDNIKLFALITNTLAKDKEIEDTWRKFPKPISYRNLSNFVEDEVVEALVASVKRAYPRLSHRYYQMKAGWLKLKKLEYYDRNAPLPKQADKLIPWPKAKSIVLESYGQFSSDIAGVAKQFFDKNWIDVPAVPGKTSGAFAHPTVPSAHPYILLNYQGKQRDVMTLAHELGHGIHQVLAGQAQGHLLSDTPLTLAETASVFGEMLTFQNLLAEEKNAATRRHLLAGKVEDMLNTVVRQIAFCEFERGVHEERRKGELTPERLGEIWIANQKAALGPAFNFKDEYKNFWAYIPHFIHSPFYVYAYAFGDCLVNSLYALYQKGTPAFAKKYHAMLSAGGSKHHKELLAPFGLNAADPKFWDMGLSMLSSFIDELENL